MTPLKRQMAKTDRGFRFPPRRMYDPTWADKLYRGLKRHSTVPFKFTCISNYDESLFREPEVEVVPFKEDIRFTMSMNEIFRPDLEHERCVFFGLDAIVVGNMDELLTAPGEMVQMKIPRRARGGNAITAWTPNSHTRELWRGYEERGWDCGGERAWRRYPTEEEYWSLNYGGEITTVGEHCPGQLLSYKREWRHGRYWGEDCAYHPLEEGMPRMLYFPGRPKAHCLPDEHKGLLKDWV